MVGACAEQRQKGVVSVIIPTYNRAALVVQAIKSVRSQTWPDVQIIVVDDGSTDNTKDLVAPFDDVLFLSQSCQGQAAARNLGLRHAHGEYLCSLDSDDLWHPTFLEKSIHALVHLDADLVFANRSEQNMNGTVFQSVFERYYRWWDFPRTEIDGWRIMTPLPARAMYLDSCVSPSSSVVWRRDAMVGEWTPGFIIADDWCLLLDNILARPCRVAFTMERLWIKRIAGDNICDGQDQVSMLRKLWFQDSWMLFKRLSVKLSRAERGKFSRRLAVSSLSLIGVEWRAGNRQAALNAAWMMIVALITALSNAPISFMEKLVVRGVYQIPHAPNHELEHEGLLPTRTVPASV
jgi:glycosyltransferase involved in cell wall biosynthesis